MIRSKTHSRGHPTIWPGAEEVAKVNPDPASRDDQGKPYTVRYEAVNVMLLNEFLNEHRKLEAQEKKVLKLEQTDSELRAPAAQQQELRAIMAKLQSALKRQGLQLQTGERAGRSESFRTARRQQRLIFFRGELHVSFGEIAPCASPSEASKG